MNNCDTWFIFATGPSFLRQDAEKVRWCKTVAVNNAVFFAPWADILYACDAKWWNCYGKSLGFFKGQRYSFQRVPGTERFYRQQGFPGLAGNSGNQAIQLVASMGAKRIGLLGFDHQHTGGKKHCHADHPKRLGNAGSVAAWSGLMEQTAKVLKRKGVEVINCSRETAITCLPRMTVDEFNDHYRNT
jgi:hypothetical protein